MILDWPIRAGFKIVNDGYDLSTFYIARAPIFIDEYRLTVPGKVSEGSLGKL